VAASVPYNVVKTEFERVAQVPINPLTSFNSGDMMKWDPVNFVATPIVSSDQANATSAALFIGVSNDTNPIFNLAQPVPDNRIVIITRATCIFTVGDNATYFPGDAVTFGNGPQTIQKTGASGGAIIGYVSPENSGFSNSSTTNNPVIGITAVSGVTQLIISLRPAFTQLTTV